MCSGGAQLKKGRRENGKRKKGEWKQETGKMDVAI